MALGLIAEETREAVAEEIEKSKGGGGNVTVSDEIPKGWQGFVKDDNGDVTFIDNR